MKKLHTLITIFLLAAIGTGCLLQSPAPEANTQKSRTIMIYLNGSDLESKHRAATNDLAEMAASGFDEKQINLLLFTGGTEQWHMDVIPNNQNAIFQMERGRMTHLKALDQEPMGDPAVLADFITFCKTHYPADRYSLIFWNHGGGAVTGFGYDEHFADDPGRAMMKLREIDEALETALEGEKLELLGFDTCLMATLEMASIAEKHADYLVASVELEPVDGWDYRFLGEITPETTAAEIGAHIIDYYAAFYADSGMEELLTLSMTDLSKVSAAYEALESLAEKAEGSLEAGEFSRVSRARALSRAFGTEEGDGPDMIDLLQLTKNLAPLFPDEAKAVQEALHDTVIYQYDNYAGTLGGLSVYFPYANKEELDHALTVYRAMGRLPNYSRFIEQFGQKLTTPPADTHVLDKPHITTDGLNLSDAQQDALSEIRVSAWGKPHDLGLAGPMGYLVRHTEQRYDPGTQNIPPPAFTLNGHPVSTGEIARNGTRIRYGIPILLNGEEAKLIALCNGSAPRILGAAPTGEDPSHLLNKKVIPLRTGDQIIPRHPAYPLGQPGKDPAWLEGTQFTLGDQLVLSTVTNPYLHYMLNLMDTERNSHYVQIDAGLAFFSGNAA
ncbi:MAG: clostripain-related cysteine peptidase [Oscillospiraceae bacterium]|nr:clostripain-related cysteine peptidase [Oscillospiraceae bacterium]